MGLIGFGNHHDAGRFFVESVYQSRSLFSADGREPTGMLKVMEQRIDQRAGPMSRCGMHDKPNRLIEDEQDIIFIQNVEGNGFWLEFERFGARDVQFDSVAGSEFLLGRTGRPFIVIRPSRINRCSADRDRLGS